jgi:hypothetical protein
MEEIKTASHIGLWITVIGLVIFLAWSAVNKKSEDNTYQRGSVDASKVVNYYPLSLGGLFGCEFIKSNGQPLHDPKERLKK